MQSAGYFITLVSAVIVFFYAVYIVIHLASWITLDKRIPLTKTPAIKLSLIIPVRNEESNIGKCLQSVFAQDYPANLTEIIISDDYSADRTKEEALNSARKYGREIRYARVTETPSNKKKAIKAGIEVSSGELIIITDADCVADKQWLSSMVAAYKNNNASMVCGPVAITGEQNLCEKFQALEMCGLSLLSGAGVKAGIPLLCNAANIAYPRKVFDTVEGFKDIEHTPSGDDTMLMFKIHKKYPGSIYYVSNPTAFVYTHAQPTWKDFFNQRIRWASKGFSSGSAMNSIVSLLVFFANFSSLLCIVLALICPFLLKILISILALKLIVDFLLLSFATKFFKKTKLLAYYPIAVIIVMLYITLVGIMANFYSYTWKERTYQ